MLSIQPIQNRLASFSEHSSGFAPICLLTSKHRQAKRKRSMDKSASQFEIVGVSRRWFCVSKIKQDSANLAQAL
ncbi:hypothetical protein MPG36_07490 (plasmid) [Helicobacter pylori]|uniref:hypothetical protein n=1 Tax=Helicobacter pylori TaxID=210 RepID=UPI001FCFC7CB|nr:hypothetical protein [Helicobacter pylori]UOR81245.1 hypothetical protein MPG36_07490 [Helicobacter pylori]